MEVDVSVILKGVWSEEMRPKTLNEVILPRRLKETFKTFIDRKDMPNLLLVSTTPGTGKTTIAKILARELHTSCLMINGSDENGIDVIRNKIKDYVNQPNVTAFYSEEEEMTPFKIVYVDEADGLKPDFQKALRGVMNEYDKNCRFIFTCNFETNLIDAVVDRFTKIRFEFSREEIMEMGEQLFERICTTLDYNKIKYNEEVVADVIIANMPRFRRVWDKLYEIYITYGNEITTQAFNEEKEVEALIAAMNTKKYENVLKFISTTSSINFTSIYSILFHNAPKLDFRQDILCFLLNEYSGKAYQSADKFLNFMGFYAELCLREKGEF